MTRRPDRTHHQIDDHEPEDHDRGLVFDLETLLHRRTALKLMAGAGLFALVGCTTTPDASATGSSATPTGAGTSVAAGGASSLSGSSSSSPVVASAGSVAESTSAATAADCEEIPQETAGPYPGDGSNGPNVLTESGIVRGDIRSSFGSSTTVATGVPLTVALTILDGGNSCGILSGAAVYLWHCDIDGNYSLYSNGVTGENYLRGVQATDSGGVVTFTTIFPACYSGRWPHIHFEVYSSLDEATAAGKISATSQLALPKDICDTVYATSGYEQSVGNLSRISLSSDNVFGDDSGVHQLATVTGDATSGYVASLVVTV